MSEAASSYRGEVAHQTAVQSRPDDADSRDRAIIARLRAGDEATLDALVRELYEPLCRVAYRVTGSPDAADDVVTEAFIALWNRADRVDDAVSVRSYLYRAVRNRALNAVRDDRRRRVVPLAAAAGVADAGQSGSASEPDADFEMALGRAVAALPERTRLAYVLSREHGMTYAEIAEVMDISVKTVEMQLSRALIALRRALSRYRP